MFESFRLWFGAPVRVFHTHGDLVVENLVLRQQLAVLKRRHPKPKLTRFDRLFWIAARQLWAGWKRSLILVTPETIARWHRSGFQVYRRLLSKVNKPLGRKRIPNELRNLLFQMVAENPTWGAPRIHGELLMRGFAVSERTISRWMRCARRNPEPAKRWLSFLRNHREAIAAMDFFTVPTVNFGVLYCFFVIGHNRRRVLHFNVTRNPTSSWISQQLREAFPFAASHKYLIFDRDQKFGHEVMEVVKALGSISTRTSFRSPWQNVSPSAGSEVTSGICWTM
jgi:putative transposase